MAFVIVMLSSCGSNSNVGTTINPLFRPYISPDTKALAGIDLEKLRQADLFRRHRSELPIEGLDGSVERIGIDPRRDIQQMLVAWVSGNPLLLFGGKFNAHDIEQHAGPFGVGKRIYGSSTIMGNDQISVAILSKELAVAGPSRELEGAIDRGSQKTGNLPDTLSTRLKEVPKESEIWAVTTSTLPFAGLNLRTDVDSILSNIVSFVNGSTTMIRIDEGAHLKMAISCISEQGAVRVHDALRGTIGFARLSTRSDEPDMLRLYDAIKVDRAGGIVNVSADLNRNLADRAIALLQSTRTLTSQH